MMAPPEQGDRFRSDPPVAVPSKASEDAPRRCGHRGLGKAQELEAVPLLIDRRGRERCDNNSGAVLPPGGDDPFDHVGSDLRLTEQSAKAPAVRAWVGALQEQPGMGCDAWVRGLGQLRRLSGGRRRVPGEHDLHGDHRQAVVIT
jgi:hypothetical protein